MDDLKNIAASVKQRILNIARVEHKLFNELMQLYAMERFLYRLSISPHSECFVLKGAMLLRVWNLAEYRTTMDIDMLGRMHLAEDSIIPIYQDILRTNVVADGVTYDTGSVSTSPIAVDAQHQGVRVGISGTLGLARFRIHVDIGFDDIVTPSPELREMPSMLDMPPVFMMCYRMETAIAEKYHAMVQHGLTNSRMKDYFDIWLFSTHHQFLSHDLADAIRVTFVMRGTELNSHTYGLSTQYAEMQQMNWQSYVKRIGRDDVPADFGVILAALSQFLEPIIASLILNHPLLMRWSDGEWK